MQNQAKNLKKTFHAAILAMQCISETLTNSETLRLASTLIKPTLYNYYEDFDEHLLFIFCLLLLLCMLVTCILVS